jgi:hypothetical protein
MGYRSADTDIDGWAYGLAAGMGDGLKAIAPFVMYWGWKRRDWLAVLAAAAVFVVITGYSLTAALGFAELHRGAKQGERRSAIERHDDLRKESKRTEARLAQLGPQRGEGEVEKAMAALLAGLSADKVRTVDQVSKGCTLNRLDARTACAELAKLAEERERAREQVRLETSLRDTRRKIDAMETGSGSSDDPQVDVLTRVAALLGREPERKDVQFALSLLVALLVELGSGLGIYVSTTPWRGNVGGAAGGTTARRKVYLGRGWRSWRRVAEPGPRGGKVRGAVDSYAMERVEPREDGELTLEDLFADYVVWCRCRGEHADGADVFARQILALAAEVGIPVKRRGNDLVLWDVALVG